MTRSIAAVNGYLAMLAHRQPRIVIGLGGLMVLALMRILAGLTIHTPI